MFYRMVVKAILLCDSEKWVFLVAMEKKVEGSHTGFLRQITGKQARRIGDGTWEAPEVEVVQEAAAMQSVMTYIGIRQAIVAHWVALQSIFEVCAWGEGI